MSKEVGDIVLWIASVPAWVVHAVIAGAFAALGILLAHLLGVKGKDAIFSVVAVVIGLQITRSVVLPTLDQKAFEAAFVNAIGPLPRQTEDGVTMVSAAINKRVAEYRFKLDFDIAGLKEAEAALREIVLQGQCERLKTVIPKYLDQANYRYETKIGLIEIPVRRTDCG